MDKKEYLCPFIHIGLDWINIVINELVDKDTYMYF